MTKVERWQQRGIDANDPRNYPVHIGIDAVIRYAAEQRKVPLTRSRVKTATETGQLAYPLVSGRRAYSENDIDAFLLGLRKSPAVSA